MVKAAQVIRNVSGRLAGLANEWAYESELSALTRTSGEGVFVIGDTTIRTLTRDLQRRYGKVC